MANTYSLLIWETVPEETDLYLIPNDVITDGLRNVLEGAHHKFINQDDDVDNTNKVSVALTNNPEYASEQYKQYLGLFVDYKVIDSKPVSANITNVYLTGFIL